MSKEQAVTAVDVVETASAPDLMKGQTVRILWPEDDPRSAKIAGARPGVPWANWFYGLGEILAIGAAGIALIAIFGYIRRRRRKARAKRL
jgi:LPXTG-motif cell wall-anchored protein